MQRVLVVRRGGLGDTLLMLPVLRALRRAHPAAALHFAGVQEFAEVLQAFGACDLARSSESLASWSPAAARDRLRGYDLVIADDPALVAAVGASAIARSFDCRSHDPAPIARQIAARLGLSLRWPEDAWLVAPVAGERTGAITLAPGSGGATKCWQQARWLELAADPLLAGRELAVVVGPTEIERDDPRCWPWPASPGFVVESSPVALASRLAGAAAFVGNDSGTTHLAAMLGVPTVAVFGPSDARIWSPVGAHVRAVVPATGLAFPPLAPVVEALRTVMAG